VLLSSRIIVRDQRFWENCSTSILTLSTFLSLYIHSWDLARITKSWKSNIYTVI